MSARLRPRSPAIHIQQARPGLRDPPPLAVRATAGSSPPKRGARRRKRNPGQSSSSSRISRCSIRATLAGEYRGIRGDEIPFRQRALAQSIHFVGARRISTLLVWASYKRSTIRKRNESKLRTYATPARDVALTVPTAATSASFDLPIMVLLPLKDDQGHHALVATWQVRSVSGFLIPEFLNGLFTKTKRSNLPSRRGISSDCSLRQNKLFSIRSLIERQWRPQLSGSRRRSWELRSAGPQIRADNRQREMCDEDFCQCQQIPFSRVCSRRDRRRRHRAGSRPVPRSHRQYDAVLL